MSETREIEERITTALATIRREWDHMIPTGAPGRRPGSGSQSARITAHDHADTGADIDPATRLVSLRRYVRDQLNAWSRVVMEDRPVTKALPDGGHVPNMCRFLHTHAQWMSGHEAAEDMAGEVETLARSVKALTQPERREWISLGSCPLEQEFDPETGAEVCGGQVRAWPRAEDRDGETMARCRRCGVEAVATWWEGQMFSDPELRQWLTDDEVVGLVHRTYGMVVTRDTIRTWVRRGVLQASSTDERGRRTFARDAVVFALDREQRRRVGADVTVV